MGALFGFCCQVCLVLCMLHLIYLIAPQVMINKVNSVLDGTVKESAKMAVRTILGLCPGNLQTSKVLPTKVAKKAIPLLNEGEWEQYITTPQQVPAPETMQGRVEWWKTRLFRTVRSSNPCSSNTGGGGRETKHGKNHPGKKLGEIFFKVFPRFSRTSAEFLP